MTQRAIVSGIFAVLVLGATSSAWADPVPTVNINLTISYDTAPHPLEVGGVMTGTAQFYSAAQNTTNYSALGNSIDIGVPITQSFTDNFAPTEPCLGLDACRIAISFSGNAQVLDQFAGFPALAFLNSGDAPSTVPPTPVLPITDNLIPTEPCFNGTVCSKSGVIMAYDLPVQVGTWSVTISSVPGPIAGAGLPGLIFAASGLLVWWRTKRRTRAGRHLVRNARCLGNQEQRAVSDSRHKHAPTRQ